MATLALEALDNPESEEREQLTTRNVRNNQAADPNGADMYYTHNPTVTTAERRCLPFSVPETQR